MYKTFVLSRDAYFNGCQLEYCETDTAFMSNAEDYLNDISADSEIIAVQFFDDANRRPYKCIITYREKETK